MNDKGKFFFILLADKITHVVFDLVNQQYACFYFTGAITGRTFFNGCNVGFRSDSLAGNLDESKFTGRQNGMFGAITLHFIFKTFKKDFTVLRIMHVDKIDYDNAAHISHPKLTGNFYRRIKINLQRICLLARFIITLYTTAAVYVNNVHGFCMLNDQISAIRHGNSFPKTCFDLFFNSEMIKNWLAAFVKFYDFCLLRSNSADVAFYFLSKSRIIDMNRIKIWIEEVAQNS